MREKLSQFCVQYRFPLIVLLLMVLAVPGGAWLIVTQIFGAHPEILYGSEPHTVAASAVDQVSEDETLAILTEPPTTSPTNPTAAPTTAPPVTEPQASAMIAHVPFYSQRSVLPTGCELVSAKMLLEYYLGKEVPIREITDRVHCQYPQTVDGKPCAPHPSQAFIGDPWDPTSYGCFATVICEMMNDLLPEDQTAIETTGTPVSELAETYIPNGQPVLLWATIAMIDSYPHGGWYLADAEGKPTDEWYDWLASEHCLVLIGYDEDYYYFNDPYAWHQCTKYSRSLVERRHEEIGGYSAVVVPETTQEAAE